MQRRTLNCWKEIATYLGCGVRTAQRWERNLGLPVRRPNVSEYRIVVAFEDELDKWREMWSKAEVSQAESFAISLDKLEEDIASLQTMVRERAHDGKVRSIVVTFAEAQAQETILTAVPVRDTPRLARNSVASSKAFGSVKQAESLLSSQVLARQADRNPGMLRKIS